ncbi:hypothetical protein YPC_1731 [Yersinia pestis biovar Medievalis str. Harbin 35]|nr:hypothetical protein YPC_1731 [Yersinia pestis biovar Medievalis str. Harbin 35]
MLLHYPDEKYGSENVDAAHAYSYETDTAYGECA